MGVEEVEGQEGIITPQDKGLLILWVMNDLERQRLGFDFAGVKGVKGELRSHQVLLGTLGRYTQLN